MKTSLFAGFLALAATVIAEPLPVVSDVAIAQEGTTAVITYSIDRAPAIVTLSLSVDGVVDDELASAAYGDVFRVVETAGSHTINLRIRKTRLRDQIVPNVKATVTAWPLSRPPDYMVVDLAENATDRVRYYASTNTLPGGLFANLAYRTTKLVMRLIRAKGVAWEMGGGGENAYIKVNKNNADFLATERIHPVELDADYWMGVFELTQSQYREVTGSWPSGVRFTVERDLRPVEGLSYSALRHVNSQGDDTLAYYPAAPGDKSFLGKLRNRTGLDFDFPGEAQWEFACRAGIGIGKFNTGLGYTKSDADYGMPAEYKAVFPGRVNWTQPDRNKASSSPTPDEAGTARVGSYAPNSFGLYDMHGNVREWCLDWFAVDITQLNGAVNAAGVNYANGEAVADLRRITRGGHWEGTSDNARSAVRTKEFETTASSAYGFRVACPLAVAADNQ